MKKLLVLGVSVLLLAGCGTASVASNNKKNNVSGHKDAYIQAQVRNSADYWQRSDAISAQYLVGPKAQYQLHTDIAACVVEVRELVRLGSIRKAMPPKNIGMDDNLKGGWNSVTRNGPLYAENQPFQDFDGCMNYKGWERANFVKPIVADNAADNYIGSVLALGQSKSIAEQTEESSNNFNK